MPGVVLILRYSKDMDPNKFADSLMQDGPGGNVEKHTVQGKPFYTLMPMVGFLVLDARTFLITPVETLPTYSRCTPPLRSASSSLAL